MSFSFSLTGSNLITAANFCLNGKFAAVGTYDGRCIFYETEVKEDMQYILYTFFAALLNLFLFSLFCSLATQVPYSVAGASSEKQESLWAQDQWY